MSSRAFCGPCFGAGDVPSHNGLSIRHTTRNFPNREGSKPGQGQLACVALMDARSIAATAANGGILTGADELDYSAEYSSGIPLMRQPIVRAAITASARRSRMRRWSSVLTLRTGPAIRPPKENLLVQPGGRNSG